MWIFEFQRVEKSIARIPFLYFSKRLNFAKDKRKVGKNTFQRPLSEKKNSFRGLWNAKNKIYLLFAEISWNGFENLARDTYLLSLK